MVNMRIVPIFPVVFGWYSHNIPMIPPQMTDSHGTPTVSPRRAAGPVGPRFHSSIGTRRTSHGGQRRWKWCEKDEDKQEIYHSDDYSYYSLSLPMIIWESKPNTNPKPPPCDDFNLENFGDHPRRDVGMERQENWKSQPIIYIILFVQIHNSHFHILNIKYNPP